MLTRTLAVAAAFAAAAILTPAVTLFAKDDPAVIAANRKKLRDEFKAAKKVPSADLAYFIDTTKLKDSRWIVKEIDPPADPDQGLMFVADFPSGNATDASSSIHVAMVKCLQQGNGKEYSHEFKSWGKSVKMAQVKLLAQGYYEDWLRECADPVKDKCKEPDKKEVGPAEYWGWAVGTDKEDKKRVRMDWFVWVSTLKAGAYTWTATSKTAEKFIDVPEWREKLVDLMKNIKELKDDRAK